MKIMGNPKYLLVILSVLVCIIVGLLLGQKLASERVPVQAQINTPEANMLVQGLAQEGWVFTPVDPNNPKDSGVTQTFISEEAATAQANKISPSFQKSPDLTGITAHLGKLNNARLQESAQRGENVDPAFLKPRLVWIVTYNGVKTPIQGTEGTSNEMNVVIDATNGEYLMEFIWTR
ncbi:MAG TPA: hypothetical protein VMS73_01675 [Anaerolineaceae bacterium]|nr:hypothetical protein [Anaerolineaceae bacterium]